jgi:hypothetical protein
VKHAARTNPHVITWTHPDTGELMAARANSRAEGETAMRDFAQRYPWNSYELFEVVSAVPASAARPAAPEVARKRDERPAPGDLPVDPQTGVEGVKPAVQPVEHVQRQPQRQQFRQPVLNSPAGTMGRRNRT